ncbi:MAG TPA: beta-N-acetylglucosaminidase domain-containing protein [Rhizomicrobium sp.]|jgi:hyaluronoglucosaminidase|nr:beta-N-acetylglucosaminidase domain-containing protein [Rhizomicrobium sp.]
MTVELGLIEGYYGAPWSWAARERTIATLKPHGYGFFLYAPKADAFLRKRWREPHPAETADALRALSARCRALGVRFGVGLSPFELYRDFHAAAQADLGRKLAEFDAWGIDDLAILFDDMRGDLPDLARTQVEIMHWVQARTKATRLIVCPSYYSDDPVLDRFFGQRPENYLEDFGRLLDKAIEIFWTGEEVCSREYSPGHLARVTGQLGRKPFLWDNYPVNDGQRMSQYLHLRAFTGRPASLACHLAAHSVNPALQPMLSCLPAMTLAESYRLGDRYEYGRAFENAAQTLLGPAFAQTLRNDILFLQDVGLERLAEKTKDRLRQRYGAIDHDAAREIVAWLNGAYKFAEEIA